ncbi:hypothetical protein OSB04_013460 [Centaurea solstitialis]|uniref:Uncharacterized protein n=1 Tax=Centaurea solstitialis TaxID=347529 RepID=A0AA38WRA4_9ASTR|nr:hypothetical protein OSB04_013460 [Centaurea solstitialis]
MSADLFQGFRHHKLWFPSRFFTINATSTTLMTITLKLLVDITSPWPTEEKLISLIFLFTMLANFLPSLGGMNDNELLTPMGPPLPVKAWCWGKTPQVRIRGFFTINATSTQLITITMNLLMDITSALPRTIKFISLIFLFTMLANFLPSLGGMDDNELFTNIMALGILISTTILELYIDQDGTYGNQYAFL